MPLMPEAAADARDRITRVLVLVENVAEYRPARRAREGQRPAAIQYASGSQNGAEGWSARKMRSPRRGVKEPSTPDLFCSSARGFDAELCAMPGVGFEPTRPCGQRILSA
jgi:hypothetical protein